MLTKFTHIKHKNNTNITHSLGTHLFMTYLLEAVNDDIPAREQ